MASWRTGAVAAVLAAAVVASLSAPANAGTSGLVREAGRAGVPGRVQEAGSAASAGFLDAVWCSGPGYCLAIGPGGSMVWNGNSWRFVEVPAGGAVLLGLGCASRTLCMAIGQIHGGSQDVIDEWNGSSWRLLHPPEGSVASVACGARNRCVTVGGRRGALAWNGTSWRRVAMPRPACAASFELTGVSCASAVSCVAVGKWKNHARHTMAVAWHGARWRLLPAPPAAVSQVSCARPGRCVAVGHGVLATWNGRSWHKVLLGGNGQDGLFASISCPSVSFCAAVGVVRQVAWNGENATEMPGTGIENAAVWCTSSANCMAVGDQISQWNGRTWTLMRINNVDIFHPVSCTSAGYCVVLGFTNNPASPKNSMAESWNGTSWRVLPLPPEDADQATISCPSARFCLAESGFLMPEAEQWNGSGWTTVPLPGEQAMGVSCSSASSCVVVGVGAASIWNGTSWQVTSTGVGFLDSVSCPTATMCMAVGYDGNSTLVAEQWNGSSWSVTYDATNFLAGEVTDHISCPTTTFCMELTGTGTMSWDGSTWQQQSPPMPVADPEGSNVSCASASTCVLVYNANAGPQIAGGTDSTGAAAGADIWNGTSWQATSPAGIVGELNGVSCASATNCMIVGAGIGSGSGRGGALAESWNGTTWIPLTPPNP